jgi:hypothetical protein
MKRLLITGGCEFIASVNEFLDLVGPEPMPPIEYLPFRSGESIARPYRRFESLLTMQHTRGT